VAEPALRLRVRTPQQVVLDASVTSLRIPADTGQVGLRPRSEPAAFVVEPGLVLADGPDGLVFLASAGGLLRCDGREAVLLTPFAVIGASADSVRAALERVLGAPRADLELRAALQRLETGILKELRGAASPAARGGEHA
jgi:F0F1-type ATP synthase epsilon subunit